MSLLALKPSLTTFASMLSSSADGQQVLSTRRGLVYLTGPSGGRALMLAAGVAAAVVVPGAAWLVTSDPEGHTLHRFGFDGRPQGPARHLGELGDGVTMVATRVAAPMAIVEGRRGVLVRSQGDDVEIEELVVASAVTAGAAPSAAPNAAGGLVAAGSGPVSFDGAADAVASEETRAMQAPVDDDTQDISDDVIDDQIEMEAADLYAALIADVREASPRVLHVVTDD